MNKIIIYIFIILALGAISCEPMDEVIDRSFQGGLVLGTDTVHFDTLFTARGSTTRRFYVKNDHNKALVVDQIKLGNQNSPYELIINGRTDKSFDDVQILGHDSLLVLVEVFIDPKDQNNPYLVKDSVIFNTNNISQNVKLISWGQDAHYLGDSVLACNTKWINDKPYVLFNSILIDSLCSLEIEKGARIYCAPNTNIFVKGTVNMEGTASERIVIRNDRLEPRFDNSFGQWGGLVFLQGSKNNTLDFVTIKHGQFGIRTETFDQDSIPDVTISNSIIHNMSSWGIISFDSDIYAENTLIHNCAEFVVANLSGGNYTYVNCTFYNACCDFQRETPATAFTNYLELDEETTITGDLSLNLINNIIYGDLEDEIVFNISENNEAELLLSNNLIKTSIQELDINDNILNEDPEFKSAFNFNFRLDSLSPAIDQGLDLGIDIDLDSMQRDEKPDLGAFEYINE